MAGKATLNMSNIGEIIHNINELIFVKNKKITSWVSVFLVIGLTYLVFNAEAGTNMLGKAEILSIIGSSGNSGEDLPRELRDFVEIQTKSNMPGDLNEGSSSQMTIENTEDRVLKSFNYRLTWKDETDPPGRPRVRRYDNQPDEFSVRVLSPEGNSTVLAISDGSSGTLTGSHELNNSEIQGSFRTGNFTIEVTLINAGDWTPSIGIGLVGLNDPGNSYELVLDLVHLEPGIEE